MSRKFEKFIRNAILFQSCEKITQKASKFGYLHSERDLSDFISQLSCGEARVALREVWGVDSVEFAEIFQNHVKKIGTTRKSEDFSHPGKHRFAPRRRAKTAEKEVQK